MQNCSHAVAGVDYAQGDCKSPQGIGRAMSEEMRGEGWRKAIPEARARVQSRWLVGVVGAVLAVLILSQRYRVYLLAERFPAVVAWGVGISLGFAFLVKILRAATTGGAVCGGMICWLVTLCTATYT